MYALTVLAGSAETNPRGSMILGVLCVAVVVGVIFWAVGRIGRKR